MDAAGAHGRPARPQRAWRARWRGPPARVAAATTARRRAARRGRGRGGRRSAPAPATRGSAPARAGYANIVVSAYQPIENYGVIGNMRTAALVGMNGSIDWYCFPAFDSPSIFGAILDDKKGGAFSIAPAMEHTAPKQFYWPDTN